MTSIGAFYTSFKSTKKKKIRAEIISQKKSLSLIFALGMK